MQRYNYYFNCATFRDNSLNLNRKRVCKHIAANDNPTTKPIQIPTAPNPKENAKNKPTDIHTMVYEIKAIIIGTLTSVIPLNIDAATTCKPSASCKLQPRQLAAKRWR